MTFPNSVNANYNPICGTLCSTTLTLTSLQIKALRATPIQILAATGANTCVNLVKAVAKLNYGGTTPFTNGQNIAIQCNAVSQSGNFTGAFITGSATQYMSVNRNGGLVASNTAFLVKNTGASEITGDVLNDSTLTIIMWYTVFAI